MKNDRKQGSQYDKIFRENIEAVIPSLMLNILGITATITEELPDDVQHTKERKPDVLKKVTDKQGNTFILQIEFQMVNDDEMVYRMGDYYFMLARKYKIPIRQFVIYIGSKTPKMVTTLTHLPFLSYEYSLLSLAEQNHQIFLKSDKPEEVVLAVLGKFNEETPENVLKHIISRLEETTTGDLALKKYFAQLRILAQLRKLETKLKDIVMDSITKYIDEEKDVAFLVGREKEKIQLITNLLAQTDFEFDKIANLSGSTVVFVGNIKEKLDAGKRD